MTWWIESILDLVAVVLSIVLYLSKVRVDIGVLNHWWRYVCSMDLSRLGLLFNWLLLWRFFTCREDLLEELLCLGCDLEELVILFGKLW